jgi:DNA-binding NarL/FixJ family response regulator
MSARPNQPAQGKKRVLVLDDHPMTRYGVSQLINSEPDLVVSAEAGTAHQALAAIQSCPPDLVLADISMPSKSGLEFIKDMQVLHPEMPVLVFSMHDDSIYAEHVLRAGASGYIMKTEGGERLLEAIHQVLGGAIYLSKRMSVAIHDVFVNRRRSSTVEPGPAMLTDREFEVFQLLGQGLSTQQIGHRLNLSVSTVGTHRHHIKKKLNLDTGVQLMQYAVRWAAAHQIE